MEYNPYRRRLLSALPVSGLWPIGVSAQTAPIISPSAEISITEWGVKGSNLAGDGERIQRALDEAPIGCDLVFPTGYYRVDRQLIVRRKVNLVGRGAVITGAIGDQDDLFAINIEDEGNRDNRAMRISGFRMWMVRGGRNCIAVYNRPPNIANMGMVIEGNVLGVSPKSSGHAISLNGIGTHFNVIRNCQVENGILLACADGTTIEDCVVFGEKPAVTVDVVSGAFQTHVVNNGLVARDGALLVRNGSQILFAGNQVEQFAAYGVNRSKSNASVAVTPADRGARHIRIIGNNFGGGTNVRTSIYAQGDCQDLFIDENVFATTGSGDDVDLNGAEVAWTRIGPNNTVRGPGRGSRAVGTVRQVVRDNGHGTFGVRKSAIALDPPRNGWTASSDLKFWKSLDGIVYFEGTWRPGRIDPGTLIALLPEGFRPAAPSFLHCGSGAPGETAALRVDADGALRVHHAQAALLYLGGASFPAADRSPYPSTDP